MLKVYSKKVVSSIVASSLVFGLGTAVIHAAPKTDAKETGRTEQNVQTGVISFDDITVARYATEITLTGTVVIDGPQLVITIPGSKDTTVTKVGDKIWRYEAMIDVSTIKGDVDIEIAAHTIYANGKHAGSIHTSAPTASQKIHVPFVTTTVAENTVWTAYDRSTNEFTLSYDEVQNWSVGDPVVTAKTMDVIGSESTVTVLGTDLDVPIANQDFVFSTESPTWEFDGETYSVTFNISITDSRGHTSTKSVTKSGLAPGQVNTISHSVTDDFGEITKSQELTAPQVPVVEVVAVKLNDLQLSLDRQNKNQFKVLATYTILYSDGSTNNVTNETLEGNIADPTSQNQNSSIKDYNIGGFTYTVTVTYHSGTKTYDASAVLKN
jgi:hypothetical protein